MVLAPATLTCCPRTARARPSNGSRSCGEAADRRVAMPARIGSRLKPTKAPKIGIEVEHAPNGRRERIGGERRTRRHDQLALAAEPSRLRVDCGFGDREHDRLAVQPYGPPVLIPANRLERGHRARREKPDTQAKSKSRGSGTRTPAARVGHYRKLSGVHRCATRFAPCHPEERPRRGILLDVIVAGLATNTSQEIPRCRSG